MDFLPLMQNNQPVYSTFGQRLRAGIIDFGFMMLFLPLIYFETISLPVAITIRIFTGMIGVIYTIYFHGNFGATLGKLAVGVRVTRPDGSPIGFKQAFLRSSVDVFFSIIMLALAIYTLINIDTQAFLSADFITRGDMIMTFYPDLQNSLDIVVLIWFFSEFLTMLFNERRRALHDYIAGTVVINKNAVNDINNL